MESSIFQSQNNLQYSLITEEQVDTFNRLWQQNEAQFQSCPDKYYYLFSKSWLEDWKNSKQKVLLSYLQNILPNFNLDISQSNGELKLQLTDYELVYFNKELMDFFEKYYQGNVFQRPAYRELDGSKTIDVYPKKVIILDL